MGTNYKMVTPRMSAMRGKIMRNPFTSALTEEPINMSRLDAKFLAEMFAEKGDINCV